jgi:hypothetical protein
MSAHPARGEDFNLTEADIADGELIGMLPELSGTVTVPPPALEQTRKQIRVDKHYGQV